jgi:hypothetical protein
MILLLAAIAVLQVPGWAEARAQLSPAAEDLSVRHQKLGKDYYVVRKGDSNKRSIVEGKWEDKPIGAIGGAPYASKDYAKAALKTFPECKGGEADEAMDHKKREKNRREESGAIFQTLDNLR